VLPCSSVSNYHAKLHYYDKRIFVTDNQSSNGTHIHLREPLEVTKGVPTTVRLGRSTITVTLQDHIKARLDPTTFFLKANNSSMNGRVSKVSLNFRYFFREMHSTHTKYTSRYSTSTPRKLPRS